MPIPATRRHVANLDLVNNQLLRACLESVTGTPTTNPALGRLAYLSTVNQEHIILCIGTAGAGSWVRVPRLEVAETVSAQWNFTAATPFAVGNATQIANLNASLLQGKTPDEAASNGSLPVRTSAGRLFVQDGSEATHAVNLRQLEAAVAGRHDKPMVRVATVIALPAHAATTTTLTASSNGAIPQIDGVSVIVGDSVLVKNETSTARNGIYTVTAVGAVGAPWVLTRRADADTSAEVLLGMSCFVDAGTTNLNSVWTLVDASAAPIVLGTTGLTFTKTGGNTLYTSGNGLSLVGSTFHLGDGSTFTTGDLFVAASGATLSRIADVATGNVLISGGVGAAPSYGKVSLTSHITGTLGATGGGTAQSAWTTGDILYASGSNALARRGIGTNGDFLRVVSGVPNWATLTAGDLGAITGSGTTGRIAKFTSASALGDSNISEAAAVVTVTGKLTVTGNIETGGRIEIAGGNKGHLSMVAQSLGVGDMVAGDLGWDGSHLIFKRDAGFIGGNAAYNLRRVALSHAVDLTTANATAGLHSALGQTMTVTHNLGTTDVVVVLRELTNNAEDVSFNWRVASAATLELFFDVTPVSGQYRIVVIG